MAELDPDRREVEAAAEEAAAIGGQSRDAPPAIADDEPDEAHRPLAEAGQGEAEGFEEAERELREHASHGDQHAARRVIRDASDLTEDPRQADGGEADHVRSSQGNDDA